LLLLRSLLRPLLLRLLLLRLLGALLLRSLLGALLLRSLLSPLLLLLRLLSGSLLRPLLLRLPFGLAFFLRVRRVNRPEKRKKGSGADNSNQLHCDRPPLLSL
jgi:hypothetical protein